MKKYPITIIESWLRSPYEPVLEALTHRFGADAAQTFKPALEAIDDVYRLEQLLDAAVLVKTVADFRQALEADDVEDFLEGRKRAIERHKQYSEAYLRAKTETS